MNNFVIGKIKGRQKMLSAKKQYRRYTRSTAASVLLFVFLSLAAIFTLLPIVYCVITSFKPLEELLIFPPKFVVIRPTMANYLSLPSLLGVLQVSIGRYIFNSAFVAIISTFLSVIVGSMAAFVFSRTNIKGRKVIFLIVQIMLLYNSVTLAVPQYLIFSKLHMIDTYWVYILPAIPSAVGVFLMKQYMDSCIPYALIEAAKIDGAGMGRIFWSIILPIVKPGAMTMMLFSFQSIWSQIPSGTVFSEEMKTLPQVMTSITQGGIARSGSAMAVTVLLMIPPIIVFLVSQSNVLETMSSSGIKG